MHPGGSGASLPPLPRPCERNSRSAGWATLVETAATKPVSHPARRRRSRLGQQRRRAELATIGLPNSACYVYERICASDGSLPSHRFTILPFALTITALGKLTTPNAGHALPLCSHNNSTSARPWRSRNFFAAARSSPPPIPTTRILSRWARANRSTRGASALQVLHVGPKIHTIVVRCARASDDTSNGFPSARFVTMTAG